MGPWELVPARRGRAAEGRRVRAENDGGAEREERRAEVAGAVRRTAGRKRPLAE